MDIKLLKLGKTKTNCYVVTCGETLETAVIDPAADGRNIAAMLTHEGLYLTQILLTHAHSDQVGGLAQLKEEYPQVPICAHADAANQLADAHTEAIFFGAETAVAPKPDRILDDGELLSIGRIRLRAFHTPTHERGHLCFYSEENLMMFCGDLLGENGRENAESFLTTKQKLSKLPEHTQLLPSHGSPTTVAYERGTNPLFS